VDVILSELADWIEVDEYEFEKYVFTCAPSRIRTCAHGSGDHRRLCYYTRRDLRKHAACGPVVGFSIAILSRAGSKVAFRMRSSRSAQECGVRPPGLAVDLVQHGPDASRRADSRRLRGAVTR